MNEKKTKRKIVFVVVHSAVDLPEKMMKMWLGREIWDRAKKEGGEESIRYFLSRPILAYRSKLLALTHFCFSIR